MKYTEGTRETTPSSFPHPLAAPICYACMLVTSASMEQSICNKNPGHADNVRFVKLYKNAGKNVIIFRNSSFNMRMDPVNVKFNKDPHKLVNAFIINR